MSLLKIEEPTIEKEELKDEPPILGIDFGTTNSLIGIVVNDEVRFFKGKDGGELHESVVVFDKDGLPRRDFAAPRNDGGDVAIKSIKRLLGKGFSDVADKLDQFDFEIVKDGEDGLKIKIGEKLWSAEEIAGMILGYLGDLAMSALQQTPRRCVPNF